LTFAVVWHHYGFGGLGTKYAAKVVKGTKTFNSSVGATFRGVRFLLQWKILKGQKGTPKTHLEEHQYAALPSSVLSKAEAAPFSSIEA
jgi:hypothetical protein